MADDQKKKNIIDLPVALSVSGGDIVVAVQNGVDTKQATIEQIGTNVNTSQTFSDLNTISKNVVGAINEILQGMGASTLDGLSDVTITSATLANGQVLKYDAMLQKWVNADPGGGSLESLSDVTITALSLSNGQFLVYDNLSDKWINKEVIHEPITQAQYDAMVQAGMVDPNVYYPITDASIKTSELDNDSNFASIDDTSTANNKAWSASKIGTELSGKANASDTYTKAQTDSAIVGLIDDTTTANNKAWSSSKITDEIINILPTGTASGSVASFNTSLALPLVSIDVDNSATKVYQRGTNLCDEVFELGDISASTGQNEPTTTVLRTRDYIPIKPDTQYFAYIGGQSSLTLRTRFYDADKNFIGNTQKNGTNVLYGDTFTSPVNAYFMRFTPQASYGTVYNNDISINYPSSNTVYNAYNSSSSEYDISQLDNINAFVGANNIFADSGDIDVTFKKSIDDAIAELQALILH